MLRTQWLGPKPDSLLHLDDPSPGPSVHTEALIGCYGHPARSRPKSARWE